MMTIVTATVTTKMRIKNGDLGVWSNYGDGDGDGDDDDDADADDPGSVYHPPLLLQ